MNRVLVVVNMTAGRGRARRDWPRLSDLLRGARDVDVVETRGPNDARDLAREAARTGVERVIAVGGDGTVSQVASSLIDTPVLLGVVPVGTGNDIARVHGLPVDPRAALRLALSGTRARIVDAGSVETHEARVGFVNLAGCGFDAEVLRRTPRWGRGAVPYLAGVVRAVWSIEPWPMRLEVDGTRTIECRGIGLAIGNGTRYGGGIRVTPRAIVDDGLFDVCVMGAVRPIELLALLPRVYTGAHEHHPAVQVFRCRDLRVEGLGSRALACQADGELIGHAPLHFRNAPRALRIVGAGE